MKKILLLALSLCAYMFLQSCGETDKPVDPNKDKANNIIFFIQTSIYNSCKYLSTSIAAIHPLPAAEMACL